ncbi:MAG: hypothetical protein LBF27_00570 [Sphingobacterium sp.]|jgi:hypothetical protein|nr:hypothetical protein [Sphingobacterium sp.]
MVNDNYNEDSKAFYSKFLDGDNLQSMESDTDKMIEKFRYKQLLIMDSIKEDLSDKELKLLQYKLRLYGDTIKTVESFRNKVKSEIETRFKDSN